jgi:uncharacterized protein
MPFEVLARLTAAGLRDPTHNVVTFIWHGGEPSVLPLAFFRRALAVQARFARDGQHVRNEFQTNGTRITDALASFLRQYDFSTGISIDGPPDLHDRHRRFVSGRGSFDDVARGIQTLRDHGVPTGVLMVVDEATLEIGPKAVFDFILDHDIKRFGFNAVCPENQPGATPGTPAHPYLAPSAMSEFMAGIFDLWLAHGDRDLHIREIDAIMDRLAGQSARACQLQGNCLGDYFIIEPDGEVAHCDLFLGDRAYRLGNIRTDSFAAMRAGPAMEALRQTRQAELTAMSACPEFGICNGWCPHETYLSRRHDPSYRAECCGLDGLIAHIRRSAQPAQPARSARQAVPLPFPTMRSRP